MVKTNFWKQLCCLIFLWKPWYFFQDCENEQHLFEIKIFFLFTVTFDQLNAFFLNESIHLIKKNKKKLTTVRYGYSIFSPQVIGWLHMPTSIWQLSSSWWEMNSETAMNWPFQNATFHPGFLSHYDNMSEARKRQY